MTNLESLYESKNENQKMVLQERMHSTKMAKEKELCLISRGSHKLGMSLELLALRQWMRRSFE